MNFDEWLDERLANAEKHDELTLDYLMPASNLLKLVRAQRQTIEQLFHLVNYDHYDYAQRTLVEGLQNRIAALEAELMR